MGGADARAPSVCGGAFAGAAPSVRPSPEKFPLSDPQQFPMPMLREVLFAGGRLFVFPLFAEMSDIRVIDVSKRPWNPVASRL